MGEALGFRLICNPREDELPSFVRRTIGLADVVFDVVAIRKTLTDGLSLLRPDGKLMLIGVPTGEEAVIPCIPVFGKELQVIASRTYFMKDFPEAIRLLSTKKVKVKPLISEILPLERFPEGIEHLEKEPEKYVKVLIRPTP